MSWIRLDFHGRIRRRVVARVVIPLVGPIGFHRVHINFGRFFRQVWYIGEHTGTSLNKNYPYNCYSLDVFHTNQLGHTTIKRRDNRC